MKTQDPIDTTIQTYRAHYDTYVAGTEQELTPVFSAWMQRFVSLLPEHGRVLEIGAGFGRGAAVCHAAGLEVLATDVVEDAVTILKQRGFETARYDFRDAPPEA